jgi:hypothetical protein
MVLTFPQKGRSLAASGRLRSLPPSIAGIVALEPSQSQRVQVRTVVCFPGDGRRIGPEPHPDVIGVLGQPPVGRGDWKVARAGHDGEEGPG